MIIQENITLGAPTTKNEQISVVAQKSSQIRLSVEALERDTTKVSAHRTLHPTSKTIGTAYTLLATTGEGEGNSTNITNITVTLAFPTEARTDLQDTIFCSFCGATNSTVGESTTVAYETTAKMQQVSEVSMTSSCTIQTFGSGSTDIVIAYASSSEKIATITNYSTIELGVTTAETGTKIKQISEIIQKSSQVHFSVKTH